MYRPLLIVLVLLCGCQTVDSRFSYPPPDLAYDPAPATGPAGAQPAPCYTQPLPAEPSFWDKTVLMLGFPFMKLWP